MTDEPFGRQPLSTTITITGGEAIDRDDMRQMLWRYLNNRIDLLTGIHRPDREIIICHPRAVND